MKSWLAGGACGIVAFVSIASVTAQTAGHSHVALSVIRLEKVANAATGANWVTRTLQAVNSSGDRAERKIYGTAIYGSVGQARSTLARREKTRRCFRNVARNYDLLFAERTGGQIRKPPADCAPNGPVPYIHLGQDSLLGYKVFKYSRSERTRTEEFMTFEYWYAPQLDCLTIKASAEFRRAVIFSPCRNR